MLAFSEPPTGFPGPMTAAMALQRSYAVIFRDALDIAEIVRQLQEEGHVVGPEDLAHISPYLTEHIRRFGEYSTRKLGLEPEAYNPHLDVDFSPLRGDGPGVMHTHAHVDRRV
ncbi:Tn3 family transposase [Nonomuraea mangrovi]|uniref:Tn3 family transposase n=1 Tax=Nonomuraea mangrovi TaxID=2316207 RepID=A0ABW4TAZ0_9ACTN